MGLLTQTGTDSRALPAYIELIKGCSEHQSQIECVVTDCSSEFCEERAAVCRNKEVGLHGVPRGLSVAGCQEPIGSGGHCRMLSWVALQL